PWLREPEPFRDEVAFVAWANAVAACLPGEEGFARVTDALASMNGNKPSLFLSALGEFRSERALAWIEANVREDVTVDWGRLAALSRLDWPRAVRWLRTGRPLSLVALDALCPAPGSVDTWVSHRK